VVEQTRRFGESIFARNWSSLPGPGSYMPTWDLEKPTSAK